MNDYQSNLLKLAASNLFLANLFSASEQLFKKSYLTLSAAEKLAVDNTVINAINTIYPILTPEFLGQPTTVPTVKDTVQ